MTDKQIKQNNILIADFMNLPKEGNGYFVENMPHIHASCLIPVDMLHYHYEWDWLFPVVERIEKTHNYFWSLECIGIGIYDFYFSQYGFEDPDQLELPDGLLVRSDERVTSFEDAKLEAVYRGVVEFIKWYNENSND